MKLKLPACSAHTNLVSENKGVVIDTNARTIKFAGLFDTYVEGAAIHLQVELPLAKGDTHYFIRGKENVRATVKKLQDMGININKLELLNA